MGIVTNAIFLVAILSLAMGDDHMVPNVEVMYSHKVNLTCMDKDTDPNPSQHTLMWLLPNGDLVKSNDDHQRVEVYSNGKQITIKEVDDEDFGIYNCIISMSNSQNYQVVRKGINLNGPYWGDLMEKYRTNLIVGGIAGAIVLVLMLGICYCMNRDHSLDKDEEERVKPSNLWMSNTNAYDNDAVELNDVEVQPKKVPPGDDDSPPPSYNNQGSLATKL